MSQIPPINAAALLKRYDLRPHKGLGQNFLDDPHALEAIATAAEIRSTDAVLEIGPGLGSLTRYLAASAREVVAVELDRNLLPALQEVLAPYDNVRIVSGDILELAPRDLELADESPLR
jgi:16S rRNA (adenine1518-N6/adenine1519-N6)-dimethyltransferase